MLRAKGLRLAGALQNNSLRNGAGHCDMDLYILAGHDVVRISQDLGDLPMGCRLDWAALEYAVGLVSAALAAGPAALIVNRFGKQELVGLGLRPWIGKALGQGIPVPTAVDPDREAGFLHWAEDMANHLLAREEAVLDWLLDRVDPVGR